MVLVVDACLADLLHETLGVHLVKRAADVAQISAYILFVVESLDPLTHEDRNHVLSTEAWSGCPLRLAKRM